MPRYYSDSSRDSPDYDSPPEDVSPGLVTRKRRTGVLKTVGDPDLGSTAIRSGKVDIPVVDFGTTITPALTPGHSRPATALGFNRRPSQLEHGQPLTAPASPVTSPNERASPRDEKRSPRADRPGSSPLGGHGRSSSQVWRAGTVLGRHSPTSGLTAEEFVQQRASAVKSPHGYVPYRSTSFSKVEQSSSRLRSGREPNSRPSSRGSLLQDFSSHLTAREQEHVARMTGGPLIHVGERSRTPDPSIGLIGAIEAREQEKRNIREGLAGHMVHEAIAHRQMTERMYGLGPYPSPSPGPEPGHVEAWANLRAQSPSTRWSVFGGSVSPLQQQQAMMHQRQSGYFVAQGGFEGR